MTNIYFLDCPYSEKDRAKSLGARWDGSERKWFVPEEKFPDIHKFNRWRPGGKVYLNCPFEEKDQAKWQGLNGIRMSSAGL
jgi:hypothetical protein